MFHLLPPSGTQEVAELRMRFYLQAEVEAELTDRLAEIESAAVLQTLLIAVPQTAG